MTDQEEPEDQNPPTAEATERIALLSQIRKRHVFGPAIRQF